MPRSSPFRVLNVRRARVRVLTCAVLAFALLAPAAPNDPAQSIMNSTNPAEFDAYLRRFPNGIFSELAQIRLGALRRTAVPPAVAPTRPAAAIPFSIEFGADTGDWARDGECDDARFEGRGTAGLMLADDRGRDAAGCRQLYEEGRIRLFGVNLASGGIDFGDDTSAGAQHGDCDDPRFAGDGMDSCPRSPTEESV